MLNDLPEKKSAKHHRLHKVLLGLVEHYIKTGKPVGSHTLQESSLDGISSATIRNYFAQLEVDGFLSQQHASGGRIPTYQAYKAYANEYKDNQIPMDKKLAQQFAELCKQETREINFFMQAATEWLSNASGCAAFLTAPRFDQDFILDIKLVEIDSTRCLAIIITDFGTIRTEVLHVDHKLNSFSLKRIEAYFRWRLTKHDKPDNITVEEEQLAQKIYNEIMVRYIVSYSTFIQEDVYRTGFSRLLSYPELRDGAILAQSLSLFENSHAMHLLLRECQKSEGLKFWVGADLAAYSDASLESAVIAVPYYINQTHAGAVGILGPMRLPYRQLFALLNYFSESLSASITNKIYKFKIDFRKPKEGIYYIKGPERQNVLLEDKRKS